MLQAVSHMVATHRAGTLLESELVMNSPNHYTRMFPQLARPPSTPHSKLEKGLEELGGKMTDDDDQKERNTVTAGYTYLGQFIDHDLTWI